MIHKAKIINNKIEFEHEFLYKQDLEHYEGKEISISIKPWKDNRTVEQNSFYWLYLQLIEKETGEDANSMHEYFKRIYLEPKILKYCGKEFKVPASTTKLNKKEFSDYISKIEEVTGVPVPDTKNLNQLEEYLN